MGLFSLYCTRELGKKRIGEVSVICKGTHTDVGRARQYLLEPMCEGQAPAERDMHSNEGLSEITSASL